MSTDVFCGRWRFQMGQNAGFVLKRANTLYKPISAFFVPLNVEPFAPQTETAVMLR
jgi:hypothetical protein